MFQDVTEEVTPQEVTDEARQALVNEVVADQFQRGDDEHKLGMTMLGGLFDFFKRYPAELVPEGYVEAYEVMYGDLPAHTKALLGSLIGFVASGYDSNPEQHDLITALATATGAIAWWGDAYDDENAVVVLDLSDLDAIFEGVARERNASTIDQMTQYGFRLDAVRFGDGQVWLAFEPDDPEALAETAAILADPETMAAIAEGDEQALDGRVTEVSFIDGRESDDGNAWDDMGTYYFEGGEA